MRTVTFPASFSQLDSIREFVNRATREAGMDEPGQCAVEMGVDEACSNIIEHAYSSSAQGEIECSIDYDNSIFTIILHDTGTPFDLTTVPMPDLTKKLEKRKIGGLGVFLIRQLMDYVKYENKGHLGNFLTLKRKITSKNDLSKVK